MENGGASPLLKLKRGTLLFYGVSFLVVTILTVLSLLFSDVSEALVGIPMIVILGATIFTDRKNIHVPPVMVILVVVAFLISFAGRMIAAEGSMLHAIANILTGVNLGLLGLILVYILLRSMPGARSENRRVVAFVAVCIAIASYAMIKLIQYGIIRSGLTSGGFDADQMMMEMLFILLGSAIVSIAYCIGKGNVFGGILNTFLEENSETLGMEDTERLEIQRIIDEGESSRVEYKSTVRKNLQTGENDKRMEKAVLKTIVAFLNSSGGNLLIGVADDGSILGADVDSFEGSKDKMGLHLSNLLSSQIGSQFLPYIDFTMTDYDGGEGTSPRTVIRVKCTPCPKAVFLKEGKVETFFVRKGPQTEELTGMTLINYVNNRARDLRRSK